MKTWILGLTTAVALSSTAGFAESIAKASITPVQAELMADMHAHLLKVGATVFARVTVDWRTTDCTLRDGAVLEGHVVSVVPHSKTIKGSEVDLAFTKAQCGDTKMGAFELMLAAMAAPPQNSDLGIMSESLPSLATGQKGVNGQMVLNSMRNSKDYNLQMETQIYQFPVVPRMEMGYVSGIRGVKLNVGAGPENSSVLTSKDHDVALEKHTLLLLVPTQGSIPLTQGDSKVEAIQPDSTGVPERAAGSGNAPAAPPVDEIDLCAPPACNVALPPSNTTNAMDLGRSAASISINQLGYAARPDRQMNSFDHDEALAYLGPRELLVAFNPHKLMTRHSLGRAGVTARVIRAALMDTETHQVTRTVDWELPDNRQYLWPLGEGRVLVHVGSELRIYGEGLKILSRVELDGPLSFVRVTPDGSFIAVGVIRERHTPELHAQLSQNLNAEPEEDITVLVLNRSFATIAKSRTRSGMMAPTLLNEGQVKLQALPNNRYRISMVTWDDQVRTISQFSSGCTPELSSIAPDLLFLVSCDKQTDGRGYRVLRPDGKLALKGGADGNEGGHAAGGSANRQAFVVKMVQSNVPMASGAIFSAADFTSEDLGVYRAADGKRLLGVRVGAPTTSRDGYALAPDGSQLAVLTRDQVAVYSVPVK
jgi:hypothetical protein